MDHGSIPDWSALAMAVVVAMVVLGLPLVLLLFR
jgi:hypothetical protein